MLLFDTDTIARRERAEAVSASMLDATLSTDLVHHDPDDVWLRIAAAQVGPVEFVHVSTSGMDTRRTARQVASDEAPTVALSLGMGRRSAIEQDGDEIAGRLSALNLVELTRPYRSYIPHGTRGWSVKIPLHELALPPGTVRQARRGIASSPVHAVFRQHLRAMGDQVERLDVGLSSSMLGTATVALARALIASATDEDRIAREAMADTLLLRVQAYVRAHLSDPRLTPQMIAAAHHISVRHLYKTFADSGLRLEQWLIALRLEGARHDLATSDGRRRTIAAVAHRWGFANPSHFTHRFRAAYGMTPREWRALKAESL
jgi:AraC-like DNA-binding protein